MKELLTLQRDYFNSNATKPVTFRIEQLKKFRQILKTYESRMGHPF